MGSVPHTSEILEQISTTVIEDTMDGIAELTEDALDEDLSAEEILNQGLMLGMHHVGAKVGEADRAQVLMRSHAQGYCDRVREVLQAR